MSKAYIAAPIFNAQQLKVVSSITMMLKLQEWKYFSPYEASRNIWKGRAPKDCTPEERAQVLKNNVDKLLWADVLVAWVGGTQDGKTDTGVTWEMGYFRALHDDNNEVGLPDPKFTVAYIDPTDVRKDMNLMLAGTVDAVAAGPAQLDRCMRMLREDSGINGTDAVREQFHPGKSLLQEEAPIS